MKGGAIELAPIVASGALLAIQQFLVSQKPAAAAAAAKSSRRASLPKVRPAFQRGGAEEDEEAELIAALKAATPEDIEKLEAMIAKAKLPEPAAATAAVPAAAADDAAEPAAAAAAAAGGARRRQQQRKRRVAGGAAATETVAAEYLPRVMPMDAIPGGGAKAKPKPKAKKMAGGQLAEYASAINKLATGV